MSYPGPVAATIVVGVDGSTPSKAALRFAVDEARLRDARVLAVHAWTYVPVAPIGEPGMLAMPSGDLPGELDAERRAAEAELQAAVEEVLDEKPSVEVDERLVEGDAGEVLVAEASGADLIVVGSRGRGGFASALLGSVSSHVVHHAACPVVVVKASD
jgi:nucleotide-binding universal stress UspA family protein